MIKFEIRGERFKKLTKHLEKLKSGQQFDILSKYGERGIDALKAATPVDTGMTASSWYYKIVKEKGVVRIEWHNDNLDEESRIPVIILIQYGHVANGSWVQAVDVVNPALKPIFDDIAREVWKEVTHA